MLPLEGITVVSLEQAVAAPFASRQLADLGARVIKIERPKVGDFARDYDQSVKGQSAYFVWLNRSKESLTLDVKHPQAAEILARLLETADVFIQNLAPGAAKRLGLSAETLMAKNPWLIVCDISGYGDTGPYAHKKAYDLLVQSEAGVLSVTGTEEAPSKVGISITDIGTGLHAYAAILAALYERERTGKGRVVEVAMQDAIYASLASNYGMVHARGEAAPDRTGNRHGGLGIAPYNVYATSDGYVVLNCPGDHHFRAVLDVMGRPDLKDDPRFLSRSSRVVNFAAVDELIESWTKTFTKDDVARRMLAAAVPCAPVRNLMEVMNDENMHARGSLQWIDHPDLGRVALPHSPLVFEGTERRPIEPSLPLGASNDAVFGEWLGHSEAQLAAYKAEGVIGYSEDELAAKAEVI
jgi:CoA:oxalate CoA-transferase